MGLPEPSWADASDEELQGLRFRDLGIGIPGSMLEGRIERLHHQLRRRGIGFRPHVWLSSEWFSPDGVPGFALPFYLAHPRLIRLERAQLLEAEGASEASGMRLLRHEAGHALDTAFQLHRQRRWRAAFGPYSKPYLRHFTPRPESDAFVVNLPRWYAQSHPAEDFAETFAVWLDPTSRWRRVYRGTPALAKLELVERLMAEVAGARPRVRCRERTESLPKLSHTLGQHYARRRARLRREPPIPFERELLALLAGTGRGSAAAHLARLGPTLRRRVGADAYSIDQVLGGMISLARERRLSPPRGGIPAGGLVELVERTLARMRRGRTRIAR